MVDTNQDYTYNYESQFHTLLTSPSQKIQPEIKHQLLHLKHLLITRLKLETSYKRQYKSIQTKYDKSFQSNFLKRNNLISSIPNFWLICISNSCQFKVFLNDNDKPVLTHLWSITCDVEDTGDYELSFGFQANDYFEDKTLKLRYIYDKNTMNIKEIVGSAIHWKGKSKEKIIKQGVMSFFLIFGRWKEGDEDIHDHEDLGCHIKEDFIPNAVEFYLDLISGKAGDESFNDEEDDYEDMDDKE